MAPRARAIFHGIVDNLAADHFAPSDIPLLRQIAVAAAMAEEAESELTTGGCVVDGRPSAWIVIQEKALRGLAALALRLRVCPQSRIFKHKDTSSARHRGAGGLSTLMELDDGD